MMQESLKGTDMNPEPLPEFDVPPVDEVVFGMLTQPVAGLAIPHFGRFWESVKDTYPKCQEAPPILPLVETFGDQAATMNLELSDVPLPRVWLVSESENYLIQLSATGFIATGDAYGPMTPIRATPPFETDSRRPLTPSAHF
jgi:uncharacterized protein (TIGR04255 family)